MALSSKEDITMNKMHELFMQVLKNRDLSRAGDLFSVPDSVIVNDLTEVLKEITAIASLPDYSQNDNDQSVVEICITRATSCIHETRSVEQHCEALVTLLESCLHHNLQISSRGEDPPHAKISSDIISCIFLNYSKKAVMQRALPIAVKFLHKGNKELSRNMASYLSLAAREHAALLSPHVQPIMDSIISGNYPLCRVLAQIYEVSPEPLQGHAMSLVSLLPHCDNQEKLALLSVFALIAKDNPTLLEASVPQLCEYLQNAQTATPTLQVFLHMATRQPSLLADHTVAIKNTARRHDSIPHGGALTTLHTTPSGSSTTSNTTTTICLAAQVIGAVGTLSKSRAQDALDFVLEYLPRSGDRAVQSVLLREATLLCSSYPALFGVFTDKVLGVRKHTSTNQINHSTTTSSTTSGTHHNQVTSGGVTIVNLGGGAHTTMISSVTNTPAHPIAIAPVPPPVTSSQVVSPAAGGYTRRAKLGDSRSTGRLHTATNTNTHRSMTRLNIPGGSVGGLHKSMTRLSSSQQINAIPPVATGGVSTVTSSSVAPTPPLSNNVIVTGTNKWGIPRLGLLSGGGITSTGGGVTVTTISPNRIHRPLSHGPLSTATSTGHTNQITINPVQVYTSSTNGTTNSVTVSSVYTESPHSVGQVNVLNSGVNSMTTQNIPVLSSYAINNQLEGSSTVTNINSTMGSAGHVNVTGPTTVTSRRANNTTVTLLNTSNNTTITNTNGSTNNSTHQRMSVFEPYPMRDTIQHFCEKHRDKIRAYMAQVSRRIPPPVRCTIEQRRQKKSAKLAFGCQVPGAGQHCLYARTCFTMRTRNARIWIHLMFIALQAKSPHALSSRDASVTSLKHCWDMLKCENKTFLTLVTSAFPCVKDQETLLNELRHSGFFDVFQLNPTTSATTTTATPTTTTTAGSTSVVTAGGGSVDRLVESGSAGEGNLEGNGANGMGLIWGCFLCTHPERAVGFLRGDAQPVIEGQLKEKKGRWRLFRRWRTRYFTLSGAHLSCKGSSGGESIDVNQIRSVKVSRGARNIPKAFEIFTGNQTLILKPKDGKNAEEWVQCLSIVVAHSHAKELPGKSNSLPARGMANSRLAI